MKVKCMLGVERLYSAQGAFLAHSQPKTNPQYSK